MLTGIESQVDRGAANPRFHFDDVTRQLIVLAPSVTGRVLDLDASLKSSANGGKRVSLTASHGTTVFFASHQLAEVRQICNRICLIEEGVTVVFSVTVVVDGALEP